MRILLLLLVSCFLLAQESKESNTDKNIAFNLLSFHAKSSIYKTFKNYPQAHNLWLDFSFAKQSIQENTSLNLAPSSISTFFFQGGYDYAFELNEARNFLGLSLEYGRSNLISNPQKGSANSLAVGIYDSFKHQNGFFFEPAFKYIFSTQELNSSLSSNLILAQIALGYRMNFIRLFYLKPAIEIGIGYIPLLFSSKIPIFFKAGGYVGIDFWSAIKGDIYLGGFYDFDAFLDQKQETPRASNHRFLLSVGTNLTLSQSFKFFLQAQKSFFGQNHLDYGITIGIRYLFGGDDLISHRPMPNERTLQQVQKELLYQAELHRQRVQEKYYLKPSELNARQQLQEKRDSPFVQEEIKSSKRQRAIRDGLRWIKPDTENYKNRNLPALQGQDQKEIESRYKRELERKYGKE